MVMIWLFMAQLSAIWYLLYHNIKSLYSKFTDQITQVLEKLYKEICNKPLCYLLWSHALMAQHYNRLKKYDQALKIIQDAIKATPTLADLYVIKARILHHMGQHIEAADEY